MGTQIMLRRVDHPPPDGLPPPEVKVVSAYQVSCDGGEGALGHPRVYYQIPREQGFVDCGYCDARFVHQEFINRTTETAVHGDDRTPGFSDRFQPADVRGDVMGKQPGGDSSDPFRGNDGGSGQHHGG